MTIAVLVFTVALALLAAYAYLDWLRQRRQFERHVKDMQRLFQDDGPGVMGREYRRWLDTLPETKEHPHV